MKNILVPTDFSECATHAARFAAGIARKTGGRITFLHVVDMPMREYGILPGQQGPDIPEGVFLLKRARQQFHEFLSQEFLQGVEVAEAVQFDGVYDSIVDQAEKHGIDLIVMGTHGKSGYVNEFFLGSNTDKLVRRSKVPVIALRHGADAESVSRIVFASDFKNAGEIPFATFKAIAEVLGAELLLLRVVTEDDFAYSAQVVPAMEAFAEAHGLRKWSCDVHTAASVQEGIVEFARLNGAGMIATVTHGRRGLSLLLNGSLTSDVTSVSHVPVMTAVF